MVRKPSRTQSPEILRCPRCDSPDTRFCCYNGRGGTKPKHYCNACRRYWIRGGTLRLAKRVLKDKVLSSGDPPSSSWSPASAVDGASTVLLENPRAPHAAAAAPSSVDLSQMRGSNGCPPFPAAVEMPHLDCPQCGSTDTGYFCSLCSRIWTPGETLCGGNFLGDNSSLSPSENVGCRQLAPPTTQQASQTAVSTASSSVAAPVTASSAFESSYEGDGFLGPLESGFLDWVDHFLQTQMHEDFRSAFLGGSEETDDCARPPSLLYQDQEPERKLQQQQSLEQGPPFRSSEHKGLQNGSQGPN